MRRSLLHQAPDERGFILVGVVTFMLALTILGLSLFALSSYEAQFFVASASREQSLQNSESGMELVKALLSAPNADLGAAHLAEGQMGITRALAYQWRSGDTTSAGPVDWDTTLVIVVAAKSGGVVRTLQAEFNPSAAESPYQRLLAAGAGITVDTYNSSSPSVLQLSGRVWQQAASDADTAWTDNVTWNSGRPIQRGGPPVPMADDFVDKWLGSSMAPSDGTDLSDHDNYRVKFIGSPTSPTFFHSPPSAVVNGYSEDHGKDWYTFYVDDELHVFVQGVAVWVVPQGVCFRDQVLLYREDPNVPSTLVIVAKANGNDPGDPNAGIWFKGGLKVVDSGLKVYLVSQGDVAITQIHDKYESHDASTVSIVAGGRITIGGPYDGHTFQLGYDPSSMDPLADQLLSQGALPVLSGGRDLVVARQTWVETTPR